MTQLSAPAAEAQLPFLPTVAPTLTCSDCASLCAKRQDGPGEARCASASGRLIGWQWSKGDASPWWCPIGISDSGA